MTTITLPRKARSKPRRSKYTAATADRHILYQMAVQNVEAEIDFVDETYKILRGRHALKLREDFCGTGHTSREWVGRRRTNTAIGLDIDQATLDWGLEHNIDPLPPATRSRVRLVNRDVLHPGRAGSRMDIVLAMNFSYWIFKTRETLREYFKSVRQSLAPGGIFFLDFYGGSEAYEVQREDRKVGPFTYVWDQNWLDPLTNHMRCYIHFKFKDGSRMDRAFCYEWRLWSMPEIRELLAEAGFSNSTVYLEGDDDDEGGDGDFQPVEEGEVCAAWLAYIVAER